VTRRLVLAVLVFAVGCSKKAEAPQIDKATISMRVDGRGEDPHGCKTSAGYTWSRLEKNCVRIFGKGARLDPKNDPGHLKMPTFVIVKNDSAELFVQSEQVPLLVRKTQDKPYENGGWQLIVGKSYILKKSGKVLFARK